MRVEVNLTGSTRLPSNTPHMRWRTGPSPHGGGDGGHSGRAGGETLHDPPRLLGTTSPHGEPVKSHSPHGVSGRRTQTEPMESGSPNGERNRSRSRNHVGCRLSEARTETWTIPRSQQAVLRWRSVREWRFHPTGQAQQRNLTHDGARWNPYPVGTTWTPRQSRSQAGCGVVVERSNQPQTVSVQWPPHYRGSGTEEVVTVRRDDPDTKPRQEPYRSRTVSEWHVNESAP